MAEGKLNERITIQFGETRKKVYNDFLNVVKEENIPKSTAGYLLLEKGILHRNNPEALVIPEPKVVEKVVYKDNIVYKDKPVEKIVYKDKPVEEHIIDSSLVSSDQGGKQESRQDTPKDTPTSTQSGWIWCIGGLIAIFTGWKIASLYVK